jgi:hypothetical protein
MGSTSVSLMPQPSLSLLNCPTVRPTREKGCDLCGMDPVRPVRSEHRILVLLP